MGLQGQLSDVSSDSIPLMLVALIAASINQIRCFLLRLCYGPPLALHVEQPSSSVVASELTTLILLSDQLSLNRLFSYRHRSSLSVSDDPCVVCLQRLKDGEHVRKLDCRHVFHKHCFEGWLHHLNFTCPLCRSPLVASGCDSQKQHRVGRDWISWLSPRS